VEYPSTAGAPRTAGRPPAARPRGRAVIGITLVVALALSALMQHVAFGYRDAAINANREKDISGPSRLANLDSFSLALLLGGLRGPLVMFLWTNSESQKGEKDLESFDTQVEMIRLLQGEFDSVHLFQIWNKVYNISAQMASLPNKYAAILDGLDYARKIDRSNPNDINIVSATGGVYADKLGNSAEKDYYMPRVRTETLPVYRMTLPAGQLNAFRKAVTDAGVDTARVRIATAGGASDVTTVTLEKVAGDRIRAAFKGTQLTVTPLPRQALRPAEGRGRRTELDTVLDENGMILPEHLKPKRALPPGSRENDGSELQYLAQFQPFPYGLSPIALGYNYNKRAQVLYRVGRQKHLQLSDLVIDNQPGLNLKAWSEEEWDRGRRLEQRGFGIAGEPVDKLPRELRTAALKLDAKPVDRPALDEAVFSYLRANQVANAAMPELESHVANFPSNLQNYSGHVQTLKAIAQLTLADARYVESILAARPEQRTALREESRAAYDEAARQYMILALKFYVEDSDAKASGFSRTDVQDRPLAELEALYRKTMSLLSSRYGKTPPNQQDIQEYDENVQRITRRRATLK
jgi:hypothetical protein